MSGPVRLIVLGATGRMGRAVLTAAAAAPEVAVVGAVSRSAEGEPVPGSPRRFTTAAEAFTALDRAVAIDFTRAEAVAAHADAAAAAGVPLVEGTTGLDAEADAALRRAAGRIPVVLAPNLSPGIAVLRRMLALAARAGLGGEATLLERHHRHKKDAPSGTARLLARSLGGDGEAEPAIVSLRQGEIVGEHTVWLGGEDEELVLTHRALDRGLFARGALRAAVWAAGAGPGLHTMDDVLGLREGPQT